MLKHWVGNYDGRREALVCAATKKRAIELIGGSRTSFNDYYRGDARPWCAEVTGAVEGVWLRPNCLRLAPDEGWQKAGWQKRSVR